MMGWSSPSWWVTVWTSCWFCAANLPSSSWATLCGAMKNNANTTTLMSHTTSRPVSSRRTRKRSILSGFLDEAGVERVPDAVAEEVERERRQDQRETGEQQEPPGDLVVPLRVADHVAPAGRRRDDPDPQVGQGGLEHDRHRDEQRGVDDDGCDHVGQDVDEHDP